MEKRLDKIEEKVDIIVDKLYSIERILDKNTESLIIHEKRTNIAEQKLEVLEAHVNKSSSTLKAHIKAIEWLFKYVIPCTIGLIVAAYKLNLFSLLK